MKAGDARAAREAADAPDIKKTLRISNPRQPPARVFLFLSGPENLYRVRIR